MEGSRFDRAFGAPGSGRRADERNEGDATLRKLIEMDPPAFLQFIGAPGNDSVKLIESGIFPHILPVDKVLRIPAPKPWIAVIGLATSRDSALVGLIETTLVCLPFSAPMAPIIVLVRPEADDPSISGEQVRRMPWGAVVSQFKYLVVRVWQQPPDRPLVDLPSEIRAGLDTSGLPALISELRERTAATTENAASESVTCLVCALPERERVDPTLLAEVAELERMAPCAYLALDRTAKYRLVSRDEGRTIMRWKLYQRGARRFGHPDERVASMIGEIVSLRRLTHLDHFLSRIDSQGYPITSWNELLAWREPADGFGGSATS